jgi:hypothetical protein
MPNADKDNEQACLMTANQPHPDEFSGEAALSFREGKENQMQE